MAESVCTILLTLFSTFITLSDLSIAPTLLVGLSLQGSLNH